MRLHNGFGPIIATDHNWLKYIFDIIIEALKCMKKDGGSKEKEEDCGDTNESCKIIVLTGKPEYKIGKFQRLVNVKVSFNVPPI